MVEEVARLLSQARGAYQREQYQIALAFFQQACQVDSHSPEALLGLGEVSSFLGFREQAVNAFLSLADLYLRAAMFEVAAEVIERIIDLDSHNPVALRFQRFIASQLRPQTEEPVSVVSAITAIERPTPTVARNIRAVSEVKSADLEHWDRADTSAPTDVADVAVDRELDELLGDLDTGAGPPPAKPKRKPNTIAFAETQIARQPPINGPTKSRFSVTLTGTEDDEATLTPVSESDFEIVTRTFEAAEITALDPDPTPEPSVIFDIDDIDDDDDDSKMITDLDHFDDIETRAAPRGMLQAIAEKDEDPFSDETVVAGDLPRLLARRTDPKFILNDEARRRIVERYDNEPGPLIEVVSPASLDDVNLDLDDDQDVNLDLDDDQDGDLETEIAEAEAEHEPEPEPQPDEDDDDFDVLTEAESEPQLPAEIDDDDRITTVVGDIPKLVASREASAFAADTEVSPVSPALLAATGTGARRSVNSWEVNTEAAVMAENVRERPAISIDAATDELDLSDFPSYEEAGESSSIVSATINLEDVNATVALEELAPISPLIAQLGDEGRAKLLGSASVLQCFAGQVICRQGEIGTDLYLLLSGQAAVERTPAGASSPQRVASLSSGAFFGEGAVLADAPRASTVRVIEDSLLVEIEREALQQLVKERPHMLTILTRYLRARLVSSMMMSSPMFLRLEMNERAKLAPLLHVHKLNPGQQVVRRGQLLTGFCTVMAGELERTDLADGTGKQLTGKIRVGDSFGTTCLEATPAAESIGAVTGCWLMRLPTDDLRELCDTHPGMLDALTAADVLAE